MANIIIVGGQWGDEGKGKVVDLLTKHFDVVARYAGGPNAGHTVRRGKIRHKLSHVPSGILTPGVTCIVGNGVVIHPDLLLEEMARLTDSGISLAGRLWLSGHAHLILSPYLEWEAAREGAGRPIGTTKRGVGPTYAAKAVRTGVRLVDLYDAETLEAKLKVATGLFSDGVLRAGGGDSNGIEALMEACVNHAKALKPFIADTCLLLDQKMKAGGRVLFEGAQGTMLDIDHGTYPYVTSSNSTSGGACTGLGVSPVRVDGVLGIFKAYTTRVGEGPFATEEPGETGALIRERGHEFGTVTGRPRRCGWFDAVAARYAALINGMDSAALTLIDVLDAFEEIQYCTAYRYKGRLLAEFPAEPWILSSVEPVYTTIKGWMRDTTHSRSWDDLPQQAIDYIKRLEDHVECDFDLVSVGPGPEQTILREVSKLSAWIDRSL